MNLNNENINGKRENTGKDSQMLKCVENMLDKIDERELHYVKVPENHIVIDFDLKDEKGGSSVHLHYICDGDGCSNCKK